MNKTAAITLALALTATTADAVPITLNSAITVTNIRVTGLDAIEFTSDEFNTSAKVAAINSGFPANSDFIQTDRGQVHTISPQGNTSASAYFNYGGTPQSPFAAETFYASAACSANDYGYAFSSAGFDEILRFTAIKPVDITMTLDYVFNSLGLSNTTSPLWSTAGVSFNIANFNEGQYFGGMTDSGLPADAGTLTNTLHFDQGETGWLALTAHADNVISIPQPPPVPEPCTLLLVGAGAGLLALCRKRAGRVQ